MTARAHAGPGAVGELGDILRHAGGDRVFLVTGRGSYASSGAEAALATHLRDRDVTRFCEFEVNPKAEDVQRGAALLREHRSDVVVAVGGGSVLDMAKLVAAYAPHAGPFEDYVLGRRQFDGAAVPLVAIPTTAGSGAEATHFAVVYLDATKYSVADERMRPGHVVLDPELTHSMPAAITASTGVDALAQAIEAYWSVRSTDDSRRLSRDAIAGAIDALPAAVAGATPAAREAMLTAAHLAGKAIDVARTTAPHALSYRFTTGWGVPHGHAVGLTLGAVFQHNDEVTDADVIDSRGAGFVRDRMTELRELLGARADDLRGFVTGLGLETRLRELGVTRADLPDIGRSVNEQRLKNNPRRLSSEAIGRLLEQLY